MYVIAACISWFGEWMERECNVNKSNGIYRCIVWMCENGEHLIVEFLRHSSTSSRSHSNISRANTNFTLTGTNSPSFDLTLFSDVIYLIFIPQSAAARFVLFTHRSLSTHIEKSVGKFHNRRMSIAYSSRETSEHNSPEDELERERARGRTKKRSDLHSHCDSFILFMIYNFNTTHK